MPSVNIPDDDDSPGLTTSKKPNTMQQESRDGLSCQYSPAAANMTLDTDDTVITDNRVGPNDPEFELASHDPYADDMDSQTAIFWRIITNGIPHFVAICKQYTRIWNMRACASKHQRILP